MDQGLKAYRQGAFEQAAVSWTEAARLYEQAGRLGEQSEALISLAQAYKALGYYTKALQGLQSASDLVTRAGDRFRLARIKDIAGNLYLTAGQSVEADQNLKEGLQLARELQDPVLSAAILNDIGNLRVTERKYEDAIRAYAESSALALATKNHAVVVRSLTNAATVSLQSGRYQEAKDMLDQAVMQVQTLDDSYDRVYDLITIGLAYNNLRPHLAAADGALLAKAFRILSDAAKVAEAIENPRAASYAWGYIGSLYKSERRYAEALDLTRRAVMAAQQAVAPEALYRWHWQMGKLFTALGKPDDAIAAYRLAIPALQSVRPELVLVSGAGPSSFRESVGPVFFEMADLLLRRAASTQEREQRESYLREARDTIEQFKVSELRDYFRDECVDAARARSTGLENVSRTAAVVYPVLLPDRMELLVSLATGLMRVSVPVEEEALKQESKEFRNKIENRTIREYLPHAQKLYNWLVRPLEPLLAALPIDTLVFVPDGAIRTIPMAALHDGKQFLISKYAIAITPGLTLTDPRPRSAIRSLSVGLTQSVRDFAPLPYVSEELESVKRLYPTTLLLNQDFLLTRFEKELKEARYSVVHIASHGQFVSDVRKTFLLAFDENLTMDQLQQYIGLFRFRDEPLELLTLSACQTAVGDDRAALGLGGVAIKAGAKSALATLWFINDKAASMLISEFYQQLQDPTTSKAVALQRAQLKMLDDPVYDHPAYWAPFLLLNNWL